MPIGGGNFTMQNKVIPGAYINFVSTGSRVSIGSRGTATLPLELNWGPENKIVTIDAGDFAKTAFSMLGYGATAPELLLIREAFKRARVLKLYRANSGGAKATKTIGGISWTATYGGTRGNDIKGAIQVNIDDELKFDVITYVGTVEVDRQVVTSAAELKPNNFVTFGAGVLAVAAATALTGGTNGTADGAAYSEYLGLIEVEEFDVIGYPGEDQTTKNLFAAFAVRLTEDEGKKVQCVLAGLPYDHEAIINVKNGVILDDGTVVGAAKAVAWVTGATAAAEINESLTNTTYEGAVDVDQKYTKSQYEAAIKAGELVFYGEGGRARVLSDINSLVTFGETKSQDLTSNRVIRVLNAWANDVARIFGASYMGAVTNSDTGRQLFKADLVTLGGQYEAIDAVSTFNADDIVIGQGIGKRDVVVSNSLQPNDSMEKLYMTVAVI